MKLGQFKTITDPEMSCVPPESDAVVARKLVTVTNKTKLEAILAEHDNKTEAYLEWIRNGKPTL